MIEKVWEKTVDNSFSDLSSGIQSIELKQAVNTFKKDIKHPLLVQFLSEDRSGDKFLTNLVSAIREFTE